LFLDAASHQRVEEMGGMNVAFISGRKLMTPRLTDTILPGVTRDSLLKLAPSLGLEIIETEISFDTLLTEIKNGTITEAFACGTAAVIVGIRGLTLESGEEIQLPSAPGPLTARLYELLTAIQYGDAPDPFGWSVKI
jgi:branched-chain amino acid aminotransferase